MGTVGFPQSNRGNSQCLMPQDGGLPAQLVGCVGEIAAMQKSFE
jgi:hypothetical protein